MIMSYLSCCLDPKITDRLLVLLCRDYFVMGKDHAFNPLVHLNPSAEPLRCAAVDQFVASLSNQVNTITSPTESSRICLTLSKLSLFI